MELNERVEQLEHEMTILKNEIQAVLLDLRESYLAHENPFEPSLSARTSQPASLDQSSEEMAAKDGMESESDGEMPTSEPSDYAKPESTPEEIALGEVKGPRGPEVQSEAQLIESRETTGERTGLAMVTALTHWVTESTKQLGQEGTRAIVEVSELMGNVPPDVKSILFKLISLTPSEYSGKITTNGCLSSLLKITELLGKCNKNEANLVSILLERKENG